jgi:hypothetical protein
MHLGSFVAVGAAAFALSGALNILADFMPVAATRVMNMAGVGLGIIGLPALYVHSHRGTGAAALAALVVATAGFVGIAGFLFADAFVLAALPAETVAGLTAGSTGMAIFAAVILYVAGVLGLVASLWRGGAVPRPALALWGVGTVPTLAAIALPAGVMTVAEILASLGVIWIAGAMWQGRGAA